MDADVIVVGAGPAGCAAAITLARRGRRTLLVERARRPQPKTCGDALLPDALHALEALGVGRQVRELGLGLGALTVTSPGGRRVRLEVPAVTLQRQRLHELLQEEARRCGVLLQQGEVLAPIREKGRVTGAAVRGEGGTPQSLRAPLVILATGSRPAILRDFGVLQRDEPSAVAIRAYFRDLTGEPADTLHICYDRHLFPGYGWVFPLPGGVYNIGCGLFTSRPGRRQPDLQLLLDHFLRVFPPARAIAAQDDQLGLPCGSILRTGLEGAMSHAAGLLVAGEALGSTLPYTGEGVGKALETGLLAAEVAEEALRAQDFSAAFLGRYGAALEARYRRLYRDYRRAERWLGRPRRLNLLARQAERHPRLRQAMAGLLTESVPPRTVFSLRGLLGWVGQQAAAERRAE